MLLPFLRELRLAELNDLNPNICRVRRLIKRWSCSTTLFRYFEQTALILAGQPSRLKILFTSLMPTSFARLLSMTIRFGMPLLANADAKIFVEVTALRFSNSMKSKFDPLPGKVLRSNVL